MPARDTQDGRRGALVSGRLLSGLFWAGVGLAPLATLLVLLGQGGAPARIGMVLALTAVVLVGLSVALARDVGPLRLELEDLVLDEAEALRDELRQDIATAGAARDRLDGRLAELERSVALLRRQLQDTAPADAGRYATGTGHPVGAGLSGGPDRSVAARAVAAVPGLRSPAGRAQVTVPPAGSTVPGPLPAGAAWSSEVSAANGDAAEPVPARVGRHWSAEADGERPAPERTPWPAGGGVPGPAGTAALTATGRGGLGSTGDGQWPAANAAPWSGVGDARWAAGRGSQWPTGNATPWPVDAAAQRSAAGAAWSVATARRTAEPTGRAPDGPAGTPAWREPYREPVTGGHHRDDRTGGW